MARSCPKPGISTGWETFERSGAIAHGTRNRATRIRRVRPDSLFGVKLPTGSYKQRNSEGEFAERTLQPGTGTTNALLGAYFTQSLPMKDLSWFAQGVGDLPVDSRDGFKPGKRFTADAGLHYDLTGQLGLLLQANVLVRGRDSGVNAEPEDSGGRALFLSPGLNFAVNRDVRLYGFFQLPLYQYVHGVQLTANKAFVVGASVKF